MEVLIQKPGDIIRPDVNFSIVRAILTQLYGLEPVDVIEMNSYEDRNFHVKSSTILHNSQITTHGWPHGYTLKILNSLESQNPNLIEAQNQLMTFLQKRGVKCPGPVATVNNKDYVTINLTTFSSDTEVANCNTMNVVRLLTFIPGQLLGQVTYTPSLFKRAGNYLAELHAIMKEFEHPSFNSRQSLWSMSSFPYLTKFLYVLENPLHLKLVEDVMKSFQDTVEPRYTELPKGLIHGDFNEQNILVHDLPDQKEKEISGVLDFADVQNSCYAFDIAIAIMYLMLESTTVNPTNVGGYFLAGFSMKRQLEECEWSVLKTCIAARFCVSLVMGLYTHTLDNENEYLLITQNKGWEILKVFWNTPEKTILDAWKNTMALK